MCLCLCLVSSAVAEGVVCAPLLRAGAKTTPLSTMPRAVPVPVPVALKEVGPDGEAGALKELELCGVALKGGVVEGRSGVEISGSSASSSSSSCPGTSLPPPLGWKKKRKKNNLSYHEFRTDGRKGRRRWMDLWLGLGMELKELVVEDGFGEGAVRVLLDGLPLPVEEPEEALEHGGGLLPAEPQLLHGGQRQPRLLLVAPHHLSSSGLLPPSVRHDSIHGAIVARLG